MVVCGSNSSSKVTKGAGVGTRADEYSEQRRWGYWCCTNKNPSKAGQCASLHIHLSGLPEAHAAGSARLAACTHCRWALQALHF
eukprot:scaffold97801_cov26-Tisochrysis_lutea.AAC.1